MLTLVALVALVTLGGSPLACHAQKAGRTYRLGMLTTTARHEWARNDPYLVAFVERLGELGFVEGRNLVIEHRVSEGKTERLPRLAVELAQLNCDVLFGSGTEPVLVAFMQASRDTPILALALDYDPFVNGHIESLARPGGRITGLTHLQSELPAKRLELLKELLPGARRIAVLADATSAAQLASAQTGAKRLGVELQVIEFKRQPYNYESAFTEATLAKADALLALGSSSFVPARRKITDLAMKHRLPSMFHHSLWAEFGGLLSYGPNFTSTFRRAAEQIGMIFNGRKPADIPFEQASTFEFVVNMKTAKALGVTIPQSILLRADRVIE